MRCRVAPFLLLLLAVRARAFDDEEARSLITVVRHDAGDEAWSAAVSRLRAADDAELTERLERVLHELRRDAERRHRHASESIEEVAARVAATARRHARDLTAWNEARDAARAWIFDRTKFPVVTDPVVGPETGFGEANRRAQAARHAFDALARTLDRDATRLARFFPDAYATARAERDLQAARWGRLTRAIGDDATPPPEPNERLCRALDAIARTDFRAARAALDRLEPGWERLTAWHAWCRRIVDANRREPHGLDRAGRDAIATLNGYRRALGIPPLRAHPALVAMANAHAEEMRKMSYFSHESPVEEHRRTSDRARLAGYRGRVHECLSQRGSPRAAIETWQYDGGHHRDLMFGVDVGLSDRAPWTLDLGEGTPGAPRPPLYVK